MAQQGGEKTFRAYSNEDAAKYAQNRLGYSDALYQTLLSHHTSSGGKLDTVVDLGCGPGIATFRLAEYFKTVIGLDPSEGMVNMARLQLETSGPSKSGADVSFEVSAAEDIDSSLIPDSSVDVITAATCAHWFDMARFWPSAARILRPGGTVAIWGSKVAAVHKSVPNADKINAALQEIEDAELEPYFEPGNLIIMRLYEDLGLPWTVKPPVADFDESTFFKKLFGTEEDYDDTPFFANEGPLVVDLDQLERMLSTGSPFTRWRQAHPDIVGTEDDIVKRIRRMIERYLHEAGVEKGQERIRGGTLGVLIMLKKRS